MLSKFVPASMKNARSLYRAVQRGREFAAAPAWNRDFPAVTGDPPSDLLSYFDAHHEGPGIWKWRHYFEIYDNHLVKFRDRSPSLVEIGIYSGGSLPMWRDYLGAGATIHGIDIEPACRAYEASGIHVHIGDQADRAFWRGFRQDVPKVDIVIDDGGHQPEQQIVSLEEMLPHMAPGGVYICEDVHGTSQRFAELAYGLASRLNAMDGFTENADDLEQRLSVTQAGAASIIRSVSFYSFMIVIELNGERRDRLVAPKHGTVWEPFLT